jgi:hypothetical protein
VPSFFSVLAEIKKYKRRKSAKQQATRVFTDLFFDDSKQGEISSDFKTSSEDKLILS